jgi:aspartate kinase
MNQEVGFGHRALGVLLAHDISFEHIPSAIDSMSIIVSDDELRGREARVMDELRAVLGASRVETQADLAISPLWARAWLSASAWPAVFSRLAEAGVNVA